MSLKGKLAALATEKIAKKAIGNGTVDNAINSVLTKLGKATGQKNAAEYVQKIEKNCLIIKSKSYSFGQLVGLYTGKTPDMRDYLGRYQILDTSGKIKYKSVASDNRIIDREFLNLYDATDHKIGYIKEHVVSMGIPLLEKEVKKCSVYLGKNKIAELKKYVSLGYLDFEVLEGNVKITHKEGKQFKIYYRENLIATLHDVPLNLKDGYAEKFIMEYDEMSNEVVAILLATAIDLINT